MRIEETEFPGLVLLSPRIFEDRRGYFLEGWNATRYRGAGIDVAFRQDNRSYSRASVLRGLHFTCRRPQGQIVWVVEGSIFDVVVDLRRDSPKFGKWFGRVLSAERQEQLYMPPGFAHGFCVLSPHAAVHYKCSEEFDPDDEAGVHWRDPTLAIDWPIANPIVSDRDAAHPTLDALPPERLPQVRFGG